MKLPILPPSLGLIQTTATKSMFAVAAALSLSGLGCSRSAPPDRTQSIAALSSDTADDDAAGQHATAALTPTELGSGGLVVGTWNLEWFFDEEQGDNFSELAKQQSAPSRTDWDWRRDAVAQRLSSAAPDILAMQEIENQRVLYDLAQAVEAQGGTSYRTAFVQGSDYFTEQDVGFLYREGVHLTQLTRFQPSPAMHDRDRFGSVSKHAAATFEIAVPGGVETVTVMTMHLRASSTANAIRTRQARSIHAWLAGRISAGENVIVMGDTNSDATELPPAAGTDLAALRGLDTPSTEDDLVDLGEYLPVDQRRTHLLRGKQFDRILVSSALVADDPTRADLVFQSVDRRDDLAVRGRRGVDTPAEHWDDYWGSDQSERDLSDHWPLFAKFSIR